ncbi:hypothetical protein NC997_14970 [Trichocoleus sp. DQ-A2]|uniref:hypothetical protein n=1 Tax=Cyanophyceae TaxID=3028117 RepID=UPI0016833D72|nr:MULTISPECIES: hypothetical protein [unclassified Coleofasciculus]MBD1836856.1 hypothetical protein [Coleofasciculus sp. FACHB-501]MBD1879667.1 hypothetical protein [Coleofasciculus sp. FACHB-T130]MBD2084529.1 hypothetical protein [Coleofasciculus sp. FACHB-542]
MRSPSSYALLAGIVVSECHFLQRLLGSIHGLSTGCNFANSRFVTIIANIPAWIDPNGR